MRLALLALAIATGAFHEVWCQRDARGPFMDQYRYYAMSAQARDVLDGSADGGAEELLHLHASHPPLYPVVGALAMLVGDGDYPSARRVNVLLAVLLVFVAYGLARSILGTWEAWLASALAAWAPLVTSFGHMYYIEALLVVLVLYSLRLIVRDHALDRPGRAALLGLMMGLGCLAKWTYPVFLFAPLLWAAWRGRAWGGLLTACGVAAVVAGPWYVVNLQGILDFFATGVVGGEGYQSARSGWDGITYYPREIVLVGLGLPLCLAALIGAVILLRRRSRPAVLLALAALVPVVVFTFVMTKKPRHLIPILPALATFGAVAIAAVPRRRLRVAAGAFLLLHVVAASFQASYSVFEAAPGIPVGSRRIPLLSQPSPIPGRPDARHWPYPEILRELVAHDASGASPVLLLCNLTSFREDGFWFWRDELDFDVEVGLVPFSYPPGHPAFAPFPLETAAEDTPGLFDARYLVVKSGICWVRYPTGLKLHHYAAWITDALLDPDGPLRRAFAPIGEWALPDGSRAFAFRVRDDADEKLHAIARWALRFAPAATPAWRVLNAAEPSDVAARDRRLAELRVRPEVLATVNATSLGQALTDLPLREDLWRLARARVPESEIGREAATILDLLEATRIREREPEAALTLARHHLHRGRKAAAVRWLRRALEGRRELEAGVSDLLREGGWTMPAGASLLEQVRRLDRR